MKERDILKLSRFRFRRDERALDEDEEMWFNEDEDELDESESHQRFYQ